MSVWKYEKTQVIATRLVWLGILFAVFGCVILGRLFYLQVLQGEKYKFLADKNRLSVRLTMPDRGIVFDRNGVRLAENKKNFQAVFIREEAADPTRVLERFWSLVATEDSVKERVKKDLKRTKAFQPVHLRDNLNFPEMALLQLNAVDLPGIHIEEGLRRFYPFGESAAAVVGYVSLLTDQDAFEDAFSPFATLAGYRMGRTGLEYAFEEEMRGMPGLLKKEVNAFGRSVRVLENTNPIKGHDLHLTLDSRLQSFATRLMREEAGAAVVLDVTTGEILALVSTPPFDTNLFTSPISVKNWNALVSDKRRPLQNKAVTGLYSPGSLFKLVVALAGLESGDIKPETTVSCKGKTNLNDHIFHCWKPSGHGKMTVRSALMHSCDVYFYEMAQKIGPEKIIETAQKLGFGTLTGIEFSGEKAGLLPTPAWKKARHGDDWRTGDTLNLSIGQGFLNATPLQMVKAVAEIANGGIRIHPHLVKKDSSETRETLGFSKAHLRLIRQGMHDVVNREKGTAFASRFVFDGQTMSGKTASTQVRRITLKERKEGVKRQEDLPWEHRDHAIFGAFAPSDNPRFAVVVFVEHGGGGARIAAPFAAQILKEALRLDALDRHRQKTSGGGK